MRFKPFKYQFFLAYELLRLWALLQLGAAGSGATIAATLPVTWYAAVPLLCLVPTFFFIALFDEDSIRPFVPGVAAIKALGIPGLIFFIMRNFADAIRFAAGGDLSILGAVFAMTAFIICDAVIGVIMYRSARQSCK
jgi:hypothetical protein